MTAASTTDLAPDAKIDTHKARQARIYGIVLIGLAVLVAAVFGYGSEGNATFGLSRPRDPWVIPNLVVPAASFNYIAAAVLAFLGVRQFMRGGSRWSTVSIAVGFALATAAFLVWATAGKSFSLTGMLSATVVAAVPIALGGLAGVLSERVAVVNIAIEGMLLAGAFTGALMGSLLGGWAGVLFAVLVGGLFGFILAALVVTYRMDQIIAGVVITLFVTGVTSYVSSQVFSEYRFLNNAPVFRAWKIPFLGDIPVIGPVLFNQNLFVYGALILVSVATYYLFHTRYGLRARSVGEHPRAADTLGINVYRTRYINVTLAGMVAGFGGAWFTLGSVGRFDENMTGGLGYIGLAAMIFGRWHPFGALMAALIFGFADSLQQKLAIVRTPIPSEFLAMAPYLATIVVVAGFVGRSRPPAADGKPYVKE
ncbi:ABC transporter permease [Oricola sp.]|uniref:ABC transporter permease n=1 Tax=Oricola sp. TaxID=1979950 RepID=UPI000C953150|nr:ABC transporter permease [Ahrensia sp.]|tara:strand:- start:8617 stop:9888 length:1272 start_codon:yes stop_codon:yes gene_type:complete